MMLDGGSGETRRNVIYTGPSTGQSRVRDLQLRVDDLNYRDEVILETPVTSGGASADTAVVTGNASPGATVPLTYLGASATGLNYTDRFLIAGDNVLVLQTGAVLAVVGLARTATIGEPEPGVIDTANFPYFLNVPGSDGVFRPAVLKDVNNHLGFGANSYINFYKDAFPVDYFARVISSNLSSYSDIESVTSSDRNDAVFVNGTLVGPSGWYDPATNTVTSIGANAARYVLVQEAHELPRYWYFTGTTSISYVGSSLVPQEFLAGGLSAPENADRIIQTPDHVWYYHFDNPSLFRYKPNDTTTPFTNNISYPGTMVGAYAVNKADGSFWAFRSSDVSRVATTGVVTVITSPWAGWSGISIHYATGWGNNRFLVAGSFTASGTGVRTPCLIEYTTAGGYSIVWADAEVGPSTAKWVRVVNNVAQWIVEEDGTTNFWLYEAQLS